MTGERPQVPENQEKCAPREESPCFLFNQTGAVDIKDKYQQREGQKNVGGLVNIKAFRATMGLKSPCRRGVDSLEESGQQKESGYF